MKLPVTARQKDLLSIIYRYIKDTGYPPTFEEMRLRLKVKSNQSVIDLLHKLETKKVIKKGQSGARTIAILPQGYEIINEQPLVPFLGVSHAGSAIPINEMAGEWQQLSRNIAKFGSDVFLLRISGDSMVNAGINDGDMVLIKNQKEFISGDIVLADIDGESTIKRFISDDKPPYVYLKSENPKYQLIPATDNMRLKGKVISIIKNKKVDQFDNIKNDIIPQTPNVTPQKPYFQTKNITIFNEDFFNLSAIENNSVDLIVTSPPYNVDIHYNAHSDNLTYQDYLTFTSKWIDKCYRLAKDDCRFCLNVPLDKNKGGQQSVGADITKIAKEIGWKYHSTIIWNEGNISRRTAWGSFMSASAPYVIAPVELILLLYKNSWKKFSGSRKSDISKTEFMQWTNGVWTFSGESKKRVGHPAPFPIELPRRCIKLFSFVGDTVLDPFLGSGTTLIASYLNNRKGIGVDFDKEYCNLAIRRLYSEARINQQSLL